MATLASIPEASSSASQGHVNKSRHHASASFERLRPRSRSRAAPPSKRLLHGRNPARKGPPTGFPPPRQAYGPRPMHEASNQEAPFCHAKGSPTESIESNRTLTSAQIIDNGPGSSPDGGSSAEQIFELSESSVDLDAFPLPPAQHNALQQHTYPLSRPTAANSNHTNPRTGYASLAPPPKPPHARNNTPAPVHRWVGDGAGDSASSAKHTSVDSAFVDAISRNITQQLRLFSTVRHSERGLGSSHRSQRSPGDRRDSQSRTSSQRVVLDRFTRDLQKYAEHTGAKGKAAYCTPTASRSAATLHTVSALMPFRPEFEAAGLAVTSKEQAQRIPTYITKAIESSRATLSRPPVVQKTNLQLPQLDGNGPSGPSGSSSMPNTEISFAPSKDVDEWRYALIDEAPKRKQKQPALLKKSKSRCLPCFPDDADQSTDPEWAHFKKPGAKSAVKPRNCPTVPAPKRSPPPLPLPLRPPPPGPPPPRPPRSPIQVADSNPSPLHRSDVPDSPLRGKSSLLKPGLASRLAATSKPAGLRRPSMTVPQENTPLPACQGEHPIPTDDASHHKHNRRPQPHPLPRLEARPLQAQPERAPTPRPPKNLEQPQLQRPYQSLPTHKVSPDLPKERKLTTVQDGRTDLPFKNPSTSKRAPCGLSSEDEYTDKVPNSPKKEKPLASRKPSKAARKQPRPVSHFDPNHLRICCRSTRGIPSRAIARPNIPRRTSSMRGSSQSTDVEFDDREIADRDVLRGLHIAASAACDEEVDAFIRNRTGMRIRRFLADLMAIETLGNRHPTHDTEHQARRRRGDMRKLKQQVRRSREIRQAGLF